MASQDFECLPCLCIPEANSLIIAATGEYSAIGTEGYCAHAAVMSLQYRKTCSCLALPDTHRLIFASTGKEAAIGTEGYCTHICGVSFHDSVTLISNGII